MTPQDNARYEWKGDRLLGNGHEFATCKTAAWAFTIAAALNETTRLQARIEELERGICETHKERLPSTVGCMVCEWLASCSAENLVRLERERDALTQERDQLRSDYTREFSERVNALEMVTKWMGEAKTLRTALRSTADLLRTAMMWVRNGPPGSDYDRRAFAKFQEQARTALKAGLSGEQPDTP